MREIAGRDLSHGRSIRRLSINKFGPGVNDVKQLTYGLLSSGCHGDCRPSETGVASRAAPLISLDFAQLAALDQPNELVPFGMRQAHGVGVLADRDALIGDLDLRAQYAVRARRGFDRFQRSESPWLLFSTKFWTAK
jgi:hypothetical protein